MHKKYFYIFSIINFCFISIFSQNNTTILVDGNNITFDNVIDVARNNAKVELSQDAKNRILKTRQYVEDLVNQEKVVYGLTTGFGFLGNVSIDKNQTTNLQSNLIRSHSAGVGNPLSEEIVRAAILLRINTFAKGFSGIRLSTVEKLIELLNKNIYPYVPEKGSVGASGDLVPLSHIALVLIGEGEVFLNGKRFETKDVLSKLNFEPVSLTSKEGLALNNGTPVLTAIAALSLFDAKKLIKNAQIAAAATMEALRARTSPFNPKLHLARPHDGQIKCAENIKRLIAGSNLMDSNTKKVQDAYSIRCFPQVMGASIDAINYVEKILLTEMNSATDNPLIFEEGAVSGGNFHGQPIALAMDFFAIAVAEIADISERRVARIVDPNLNDNLPAFLVNSSGLNSGFMIPQYTAAALVSENKVLAHPASVDSIPTCANQEDHVSMGSIASRKALSVLNNTYSVIAIELYNAIQALDFRENKPGKAISAVKNLVREKVEFVSDDRIMYKDMAKIEQMLRDGSLINAVEKEIGEIAI